ncbi:Hypothetical_protein [Hexamita inflata]|uniref:Hypothetical_protein n=1 Tax=Hexamita inflata TaxID=28002 RepID=A0ABP1JGJ1_9EUKA
MMKTKRFQVPKLNLSPLSRQGSQSINVSTRDKFELDAEKTLRNIIMDNRDLEDLSHKLKQNKLFQIPTLEFSLIRMEYDQIEYRLAQALKYSQTHFQNFVQNVEAIAQIEENLEQSIYYEDTTLKQLEFELKMVNKLINFRQEDRKKVQTLFQKLYDLQSFVLNLIK